MASPFPFDLRGVAVGRGEKCSSTAAAAAAPSMTQTALHRLPVFAELGNLHKWHPKTEIWSAAKPSRISARAAEAGGHRRFGGLIPPNENRGILSGLCWARAPVLCCTAGPGMRRHVKTHLFAPADPSQPQPVRPSRPVHRALVMIDARDRSLWGR